MAKGPTPARRLPQFCAVRDLGAVGPHLQEQVVDVGVVALRRSHDGDLGGQGMTSAHPVDLARVG